MRNPIRPSKNCKQTMSDAKHRLTSDTISPENLFSARVVHAAEGVGVASPERGRLRVRVYDPEVKFISLANARPGRSAQRGPAG